MEHRENVDLIFASHRDNAVTPKDKFECVPPFTHEVAQSFEGLSL